LKFNREKEKLKGKKHFTQAGEDNSELEQMHRCKKYK